MIDWQGIRQRWEADGSKRDERGRRLFAASEARAAGWGGLAAVSSITGLARSTIGRGLNLDAPPLAAGQVRREGGGPRSLTETPSARCSASRAGLRRRPMPTFIPARGRTLHVAGVCINRIGKERSIASSHPSPVRRAHRSSYLRGLPGLLPDGHAEAAAGALAPGLTPRAVLEKLAAIQ